MFQFFSILFLFSKVIVPRFGSEEFITQKLDHYDRKNERTFLQRFFDFNNLTKTSERVNSLIVYLGSDMEEDEQGSILKLAKETNSALFSLEPRFFGKSYPQNYTQDDRKYLSVKQTLEDVAHFIKERKDKHCKDFCSVSVVGGFYSGSIASWFKQKYPKLANFSWSSSAPLDVKNDFSEFDYYMYKILSKSRPQCYRNSKNIINYLTEISDNATSERWLDFTESMNFKKSHEPTSALLIVADFFTYLVRTNKKYRLLDAYCDQQQGYFQNMTAFYDVFSQLMIAMNSSADDMDPFYVTEEKPDQKSWLWLQCTELGWFETSSSMFRSKKIDVDYYKGLCKSLFDINDLPNNANFNAIYGGPNPYNPMSIYTNGAEDPWASLSVHLPKNTIKRESFWIDEEGHCSDLAAESNEDSLYLKMTRALIYDQFNKWIGRDCENKCSNGNCVYGNCICNKYRTGDWCEEKIVNNSSFKFFSAISVLLPTIITIACGIAAWKIYGGVTKLVSFATLNE